MILLRSTHDAMLAEKDKTISVLLSEVSFLRNMVNPRQRDSNLQIEADAVVEGRQEQIEAAPASPKDPRQDEVAAERARILGGNY